VKTKAKEPPETRRLGYARVSTYGQTLYAQLAQLRGAGCTKIYREKATGARPDRRKLLKLLTALALGDVVTVTRIDRLARSIFDLFSIVKQIVDKGGQFRSLAEPRHCNRHRALDDRRVWWTGRRGARPDPHPHCGGPQPRQGTRAAHGPTLETHRGTAGRGTTATGGGCHACRTRAQLPRGEKHDFEAYRLRGETSMPFDVGPTMQTTNG
jgi:Resolvase, N terminal domain